MAEPTPGELAAKLVAMTQDAEPGKESLSRQTGSANKGSVKSLSPDPPVEGALNAEGHRPVRERSRKVR